MADKNAVKELNLIGSGTTVEGTGGTADRPGEPLRPATQRCGCRHRVGRRHGHWAGVSCQDAGLRRCHELPVRQYPVDQATATCGWLIAMDVKVVVVWDWASIRKLLALCFDEEFAAVPRRWV